MKDLAGMKEEEIATFIKIAAPNAKDGYFSIKESTKHLYNL